MAVAAALISKVDGKCLLSRRLIAEEHSAHMHDAAREVALMADANQFVRHAQPRHNLRGGCKMS